MKMNIPIQVFSIPGIEGLWFIFGSRQDLAKKVPNAVPLDRPLQPGDCCRGFSSL